VLYHLDHAPQTFFAFVFFLLFVLFFDFSGWNIAFLFGTDLGPWSSHSLPPKQLGSQAQATIPYSHLLFLVSTQPPIFYYSNKEQMNILVKWWSQESRPSFSDSQTHILALYHTAIHGDLMVQWTKAEASKTQLEILVRQLENNSFSSPGIYSQAC
jgi:hypothetical protein